MGLCQPKQDEDRHMAVVIIPDFGTTITEFEALPKYEWHAYSAKSIFGKAIYTWCCVPLLKIWFKSKKEKCKYLNSVLSLLTEVAGFTSCFKKFIHSTTAHFSFAGIFFGTTYSMRFYSCLLHIIFCGEGNWKNVWDKNSISF